MHGARPQSLTRWFSGSLCALALPAFAAACSGAPEGAITDGPFAGAEGNVNSDGTGNDGDPNAQSATDLRADPALPEARSPEGLSEDEALAAGDTEPMLARVVVERSATADGDENAQAFAHFVEMRAGSERTLEIVGLGTRLPALPAAAQDRCRADLDAEVATFDGASLANVVELELLDAGAIQVRLTRGEGAANEDSAANEGRAAHEDSVVSLAPHAFPSVSSFASGLVYTTRDRSAEALPSDAFYTVTVSGVAEAGSHGAVSPGSILNRANKAAQVPALSFAGQAPRDLAQVTLGGVPLEGVRGVKAGDPLDVTWEVGQAGDKVYVELSRADDGRREVVCVFPDEAGAGSVNAELMSAALMSTSRGEHRLSVHRLRSVVAQPEVVNGSAVQTELQFDFELSRTLIVGNEVVLEEPVVDAVLLDSASLDSASLEAAPFEAAPLEAAEPVAPVVP